MAQITTSVTIPTKRVDKTTYWNGAVTTNEVVSGRDFFRETRPERVRARKPTGWLYPKPYSMQTFRSNEISGELETRYFNVPGKPIIYGFSGYLGSLIDGGQEVGLPSSDENLRRYSIIRALTKLKDQRVNLGVALAEAQMTANFVGTTASALARSAQSALNGDFKQAVRQLGINDYRKIPKGWLGWQYAATPLMNDVYGSISALEKRKDPFEWTITVKAGPRRTTREQTVLHIQQNISPGCVFDDRSVVGYFTRLDYYPGNTFLSTLSSVGATNPLEIIWERVPFSFVADWFIPIGEWLSTLDAALGFEFLSGSTTEFLERKRRVFPASEPLTAGYTLLKAQFGGSERRLSVIRTVHPSSPLIGRPRIKNPLSLTHMANGLSLLATVFGGTAPKTWR